MILIKKLTIRDYFYNKFLLYRFWFYRNFNRKKLKNISSERKEGYECTFRDDFDEISWGNSDDNKKWIIGQGWDPYKPGALAYPGPAELVEGKSLAKFTSKYNPEMRDDGTGKKFLVPYQSSTLSTFMSFRQKYGRFELRCTIPHDKGAFPAFWMWGKTWPPELDVFEMYGKKNGKTAGIQRVNGVFGSSYESRDFFVKGWYIRIERKNAKHDFHEFVCEWTPDKVTYITDGVKIFEYTNKEVLDKWYNVDNSQMMVVVNHCVDDREVAGMPNDDKNYYSEFLVDYVRVYKSYN